MPRCGGGGDDSGGGGGGSSGSWWYVCACVLVCIMLGELLGSVVWFLHLILKRIGYYLFQIFLRPCSFSLSGISIVHL